jgi:hypothetical protein
VILLVPVANEDGDVAVGCPKGTAINDRRSVDNDAAEAADGIGQFRPNPCSNTVFRRRRHCNGSTCPGTRCSSRMCPPACDSYNLTKLILFNNVVTGSRLWSAVVVHSNHATARCQWGSGGYRRCSAWSWPAMSSPVKSRTTGSDLCNSQRQYVAIIVALLPMW